jgi:hypothetical protein
MGERESHESVDGDQPARHETIGRLEVGVSSRSRAWRLARLDILFDDALGDPGTERSLVEGDELATRYKAEMVERFGHEHAGHMRIPRDRQDDGTHTRRLGPNRER